MRPPVLAAPGPFSKPLATSADGLALGRHLLHCARARGRGFELRCLGERVHGIVGPRFCTTVFAAAGLLTLLVAAA
jgi:hypothetical protein